MANEKQILLAIRIADYIYSQDKTLAAHLGWANTSNADNKSFEKGTTRIWQIREGWQIADLIYAGAKNNMGEPARSYCNHRPVKTLREALIDESLKLMQD